MSTELGMYEHGAGGDRMSGRHQSLDGRQGQTPYYAPSAEHLIGYPSQQMPTGRSNAGPSHLSGIALSN